MLKEDVYVCVLNRKLAKGTPAKWRDAYLNGAPRVLTQVRHHVDCHGCACGAVPGVFVGRTRDVQMQEHHMGCAVHEGDSFLQCGCLPAPTPRPGSFKPWKL